MRIRIANKGIHYSQTAETLDEANACYGPVWVEIDGHRTDAVLGSRVEQDSSRGGNFAVVTLTFSAVVEMVVVGADGEILTEPIA